MIKKIWIDLSILILILSIVDCYLRPQETGSRQIKTLDGIWKFKISPELRLKNTLNDEELYDLLKENVSCHF
jgi:hypothetical protein